MPSLVDALNDPSKKPTIVEDCLALIDAEVKTKNLFIKAGYKTVSGIKPGFIRNVVSDLLPEFAGALEPMHQEAVSAGKDVVAHFSSNAGRAADAMLSITDKKAERSTNGVVKKAYGSLRGMAKSNVEAAIPALARLITKHAS
jgi:hypothetical protein